MSVRAVLRLISCGACRILSPNSTFSRTVSQGKEVYDWKTMPRSGPGPWTSFPLTKIFPLVGDISPATMRNKEVLPQPDGPTTATNVPTPVEQEKSSRAETGPCREGYTLDTRSTSKKGGCLGSFASKARGYVSFVGEPPRRP